MTKRTSDNLRIKRKYLVWLADAKGLSKASVDKAAATIARYEHFLAGKDFRAFHPERARAFKRHLANQRNERTGSPLSANTIGSILRDVMSFFQWLADQPGYKSRIARDDIAYLTPDRKSEQARRVSLWKPHPSLEQVHHVISAMPSASDETLISGRATRTSRPRIRLTGEAPVWVVSAARAGPGLVLELLHLVAAMSLRQPPVPLALMPGAARRRAVIPRRL